MPKGKRVVLSYRQALGIAVQLNTPERYAPYIARMTDVNVNTVRSDIRTFAKYQELYAGLKKDEAGEES